MVQYFQKKNIFNFCPWKHKKRASKVAHNRPQTFFHSTGPAAQTSPELIFHIINMSQDSSVSLSVLYNLEVRKENEGLIYYKKKNVREFFFYGLCLGSEREKDN